MIPYQLPASGELEQQLWQFIPEKTAMQTPLVFLASIAAIMLDPVLWVALLIGWRMKKKDAVAVAVAGIAWGVVTGLIVVGMSPYIMRHMEKAHFWLAKIIAGCLLAFLGYWIARRIDKKKEAPAADGAAGPEPSALERLSAAMKGRKYPYCAERIKAEAIVCKHCGRDVPH